MKAKISVVLLFIFLCVTLQLPEVVSAKESCSLNKTKLTLQVGNQYQLSLTIPEYSDDFFYYYYDPCIWSTSNPSVAIVNSGYVTVVGKGKAIITAEYKGKQYTCTITAKASTYRVSHTTLTAKTFLETTLSLTYTDAVEYYDYQVYKIAEDQREAQEYNGLSLSVDGSTGNVSIHPQQSGNYHVYFYAYAYDERTEQIQRYSASSTIVTVTTHGLEEHSIGCALSTKRRLTYGDLSNVTFLIEHPEIATVSASGVITPVSIGSTELTMTGYNNLGELETYTCQVYTSDPQVTLKSPYIQLNEYVTFDVTGASYEESMIYSSADHNIIQSREYDLYAVKEGTTKVAVTVDGKKFVFSVDVVNPRLEYETYILYPSKKEQISLMGLSKSMKEEKVTYSVDDTSIATVSKTGKLKAKACGNTILTVKVGDFSLQAGISVGSKTSVQAVNNAMKVIGSAYSQDKRMQTGYYDCSSLVWRSYSPLKVTFGSASYAPTAAAIGKYMNDTKKIIATEYTDPMELQPGDLIFYGGDNNGRFKNINHVSMFTGISPGFSYHDFWGDFGEESTFCNATGYIVHAASGGVQTSEYTSTYGKIVLIARPTK